MLKHLPETDPAPDEGDDPPDDRRGPRPSSGEAPFGIDEVFFSRTDDRGVIQSGNYTFRRVSDYDWPELVGAPHRVVRHPEMPRGVFWLFWDTIRKGRPLGAYVNNRAKDGLNYWVFAAVFPCPGGYLSARIKPSSPLFETVRTEYADLLAAEQSEGLSPEQSAARLLGRLRDLGFDTYERFESHALAEELQARNAAIGRQRASRIPRFRRILDAANRLKTATDGLVREFQAVHIIPHNMRVMASRLEPTGGPFSTLSGNYGAMSSEISRWFETHVVGKDGNFARIAGSAYHAMFMEGIVEILGQCDLQIQRERRALGRFDVEAERAVLKEVLGRFEEESERSQRLVRDEARRIGMACKTMSRHVLGLSTTRVLCKIESARMGAAGEGLADIIGQLGRFQEKIGAQLDEIERVSEAIQASAENRAAR